MEKQKLTILAVVIVVVLIIAGFVVMGKSSNNQAMVKDTDLTIRVEESAESMDSDKITNEDEPEAMMDKENGDKMMIGGASYVPYTKENLNSSSDTKRVLYFFANWCPTCIPVDKDLTDNASKIKNGVTVIRVNYNDPDTDAEEKALATKYGVTYQHTFVQIDQNGDEVVKWNGGGLKEINANTK